MNKLKFELLKMLISEDSDYSHDAYAAHRQIDFSAYIGKKVIVRSGQSGVHFGELSQAYGESVELINSRRCWRWWSKDGISLSALALNGMDLTKLNDVKVTCAVARMIVTGVCEIIPCSETAIESFSGVPNAS